MQADAHSSHHGCPLLEDSTSFMEEFKLNKKHVTLMKGCLIVFILFLALGFALPFIPDENNEKPNGTLFVMIMCTVLFGFLAVFTWLTLRKLPYVDIASDDDGIWYLHIGKENGLVSWGKISRIKERACLQCLDLLDCNGERLLRVEYQLNGFEVIRNIINEKNSSINPVFHQSKFSKSPLYHLFYLTSVLGFSALGIYVGSNGNPVLGYGAMSVLVVVIIYEYFVTATGVNICNGYLEIVYPLTKRNVPFSDIEDIRILDEFNKGNRMPVVWIVSKKSKKPFKLRHIGADSNVIYNSLRAVVKM